MARRIPQNPTKKFRKRLRIVITQKEIDEARRAKSNYCMVQQALKRDYPKFENIWVDKNQIRCTDPVANCIYTFEMPPRGKIMLLKWDNGEMVKPIELFARNPIVRERQLIAGAMRPKDSQQRTTQHRGPISRPKTKEARLRSGRDRVFGLKQWSDELAKVRTDLEVTVPSEQAT